MRDCLDLLFQRNRDFLSDSPVFQTEFFSFVILYCKEFNSSEIVCAGILIHLLIVSISRSNQSTEELEVGL